MKNEGEISVIIANYNCGEYLADAITSLIDQSYPFWHAYVVDDNSLDQPEFLNIRQTITDPRIKWFKTDKNVGQYRIYNHLLKHISTKYIALQDADDQSEINRFESLIKFLETNGADIVGSAVRMIRPAEVKIRKLPGNVNKSLMFGFRKGLFFGGTMLARTQFLKDIGGFDGATRFAGDSELIYRAVFKGKVMNHPGALYRYLIRSNSTTQSPETGFSSPARKKYAREIRKKFIENFLLSKLPFRKVALQLNTNPNDIDFNVDSI